VVILLDEKVSVYRCPTFNLGQGVRHI